MPTPGRSQSSAPMPSQIVVLHAASKIGSQAIFDAESDCRHLRLDGDFHLLAADVQIESSRLASHRLGYSRTLYMYPRVPSAMVWPSHNLDHSSFTPCDYSLQIGHTLECAVSVSA